MKRHTKLYSVLAYITWIGFFISLLMRDKSDRVVNRHLDQALLINVIESIAGFLARRGGIIGTVGSVAGLACFILFIMGILRALKESEEPLPFIGQFNIFSN